MTHPQEIPVRAVLLARGDEPRAQVMPAYDGDPLPLAELNMAGTGFQNDGLAALVCGIVAAIGSGAASVVLRKRVTSGTRLLLVGTQVASLIATLVFANGLAGFGYLSLGWSVPVCIISALIGATTMIFMREQPAS